MCFLPVIRQVQIDENQADQTDRNVEKEDDPPVEISNNQAARDGTKHRSNQGRYGDKTHGAEEVGFVEGSDQGETAYRHHHGATESLQDAACDEYVNVA
jgi:hypothetical protein